MAHTLERLLWRLPLATAPHNQALIRWLIEQVERGRFEASAVEPSLGDGACGFRLIANATVPRDARAERAPVLVEMMHELGLRDPTLEAAVASWLETREREVFIGYADEPDKRRVKVYFRANDPTDLANAARAVGGVQPAACGRAHMLGADFSAGSLVAVKWYERIDRDEARRGFADSRLLRFIESRTEAARALYRCTRSAPDGSTLDESLHAQVDASPPDIGAAWASAAGAPSLAEWLTATCRELPVQVRVVSETRGGGSTVYLALGGSPTPSFTHSNRRP
jgi:hypothetical protein